jgi:hypothetical protein
MANKHVVPDPKGRGVKTPGKATPDSIHSTHEAAERAAKDAVRNAGGGEVIIHGREGKIRDSDTVAPGRI